MDKHDIWPVIHAERKALARAGGNPFMDYQLPAAVEPPLPAQQCHGENGSYEQELPRFHSEIKRY